MIRTLIVAVYLIFALIFSIPSLIRAKGFAKKGKIKEKDELTNKVIKSLGKGLVKLSGARVKIIGEENIPKDGSALFVSNHQSNFDIPILVAITNIPIAFIAKMELSKIPLLSRWMEQMNCVFIDRRDVRQSLKAIKKGAKLLKDGYSLVIFPEGTRSEDGRMKDFKPGGLKLATKSKSRVVPVTIKGAHKIMPKGKLKIMPADVEVVFLKPIIVDEEIAKDSKALSDRVKEVIEKELEK